MLDKSDQRKWYYLSIRDTFVLAGMSLGAAIFEYGKRHLHPLPEFFWSIGPIFMLGGAMIGELVKRRRVQGDRRAQAPDV
jgi:hypothetical protein